MLEMHDGAQRQELYESQCDPVSGVDGEVDEVDFCGLLMRREHPKVVRVVVVEMTLGSVVRKRWQTTIVVLVAPPGMFIYLCIHLTVYLVLNLFW